MSSFAPEPEPDGASSGEPEAPREALTLTHHHPGRLRVRAVAFQDGDVGARVVAALEAVPGIEVVRHNPRTGSILVEYEPGLAHPEAVLARIAAAADLDPPTDDRPRGREPAIVAIDAAREVNELVDELTGHRADLRSLVPMGMAALAAYSFVYHGDARLPRWDNLLYWSYNIFSQLHRREIEKRSLASEALRGASPDQALRGASLDEKGLDPKP
jgi:hypothetical protein